MGLQDKEVKKSTILVSVTNFEMSDAADLLKRELVEHCGGRYVTVLVDSSSSKRPKLVDEIVANEYYTGLWNKSVEMAIKGGFKWLFFIASDVEVDSLSELCGLFCSVSEDPKIGVYCPSVDNKSRFSFKECKFGGTKGIRDCKSIEGFCFMARVEILREVYPVKNNKYGYCIDTLTCEIARRMGYRVVVDDRSIIYHPISSSSIDKREATRTGMAFYWAGVEAFDKNWPTTKS